MKVPGLERPEVVVLAVLGTLVGIGASFWLLPPEWGWWSRLGAGLAFGLTAVLVLFANRVIGGSDFE